MQTYHIHIKGLVQGVGFRPHIYKTALAYNICGWVCNTNDGVHAEITAKPSAAKDFYRDVIFNAPCNAMITHSEIVLIEPKIFTEFKIVESDTEQQPDLLLTPDIALCDSCKKEMKDVENKRFAYPFTTCLNCGPRFSITTSLPYDRVNTTMKRFKMCDHCKHEYENVHDKRNYSQTNSCPDCAIKMHLYQTREEQFILEDHEKIDYAVKLFKEGNIIAVKGIGGYLLMCDATNEKTVRTLRERKNRPTKPLAVLYPSIEMAEHDVYVRECEKKELTSKVSPVVLCKIKPVQNHGNGLCLQTLAPGLDKLGVLLPYAPLLMLLSEKFDRPLVATSGNISGSPIIYKNDVALDSLFSIADYILTNEREIVMPQDDSVVQFTESEQRIVIRRSRGLAPNYFPNPFTLHENILAMGGELKSAFACTANQHLYVSQYLGEQSDFLSQQSYQHTLDHFSQLLKTEVDQVVIDKHPAYNVSELGKRIALDNKVDLVETQHHRIHFAAVLAENNLLNCKEPVLGFAWDGTGYGDDHEIWGSEIFVFDNHEMTNVGHLQYFPQMLADKMSKEPRLSAFSLLKDFAESRYLIQKYFSEIEWSYYQKLSEQKKVLQTRSMGRFLDALAAIIGVKIYNNYEGEAAMCMEALARNTSYKPLQYYSLPLIDSRLDWKIFLQEFLYDVKYGKDPGLISWKVFYSLAHAVVVIAKQLEIKKVAFSGGVFQNALLVDLIKELAGNSLQLYFHQQLSPNDECIGFGQIAYQQIKQNLKVEQEKFYAEFAN